MSKLEKMKENYDQIPIPKELNIRIQQEIQKSQKQWEEKSRIQQKLRFQKTIRAAAATAAAVCILFTTALNTSPVFAKRQRSFP